MLTLWLAVVPVLTVPFIIGGVARADIVWCLAIELCVGMLCLAAGVLASSLTDKRGIAFLLAYGLAGALLLGANKFPLGGVSGGLTGAQLSAFLAGPPPMGYSVQMAYRVPASGFAGPGLLGANQFPVGGIAGSLSGSPTSTFSVPGPRPMAYSVPAGGFAGPGGWPARPVYGGRRARIPVPVPSPISRVWVLAGEMGAAGLILLASIRFAGYSVERSWRDKPPSARLQKLVSIYCTPLSKRFFARRMQRVLEWNPIAWLQQYSWRARLSKWGLCLLAVVIECAAIDPSSPFEIAPRTALFLPILAAAYTFAGVNGFLNDKRSGALELILVSPLSVNEIIFGRVLGLWKQFFPAAAIVAGCDIAAGVMIDRSPLLYLKDVEMLMVFLTLPIFATAAALRVKNVVLAGVLTWGGLGLAASGSLLFNLPEYALGAGLALVVGNIYFAGLALSLVQRGLVRRDFAC